MFARFKNSLNFPLLRAFVRINLEMIYKMPFYTPQKATFEHRKATF